MTSRRLLSAGLFALTLGGVGCAVLPDFAGGDNCASVRADDAGCGFLPSGDGSGDAQAFTWDAGVEASTPPTLARQSLCSGDCTPDDPLACAADGGDAGGEACRVTLHAGQESSTQCAQAGVGEDGDSCTKSSDCAAGLECVGLAGTCRHYCCADSACSTMTNTDYGTYFCDVAVEHAETGAIVPVCNFAKTCDLFGMNQCGANQDCTIIAPSNDPDYAAGCVEVGLVPAGGSCEKDHCKSGLACLGTVGQRTCQQVCDDSHKCTENPATPICDTKSPALHNLPPGTGTCGSS